MASPAEIVQQLLIDLGLGSDPTVKPLGNWPVYATAEPSLPDNVLTVTGTQGIDIGRIMPTGEAQTYPGFQIRIRSGDYSTGYDKSETIRNTLSQILNPRSITVRSVTYTVLAIVGIGEILDIGKNVPSSKRSIFTLNALLVYR